MATPTPSNFHNVTSSEHFQSIMNSNLECVTLINFWAPWAEPCKAMNELVLELAKKYPNDIQVLQIEAEEQPDIAETFDVQSVPLVAVIRGHESLTRIEGADAAGLTQAVAKYTQKVTAPLSKTTQAPAAAPTVSAEVNEKQETPEELKERMIKLMNKSKVVLFMKGNPETPRCGFSRKTVALLNDQNVKFTSFDILSDESVRQGLKELNSWPTFPQIIVNGEFVGGLDVVTEMVENGEFAGILEQ